MGTVYLVGCRQIVGFLCFACNHTREMQGIVAQASDFTLGGQLSAFCERKSQRSTELSCRRFEEERSRKSKAIDEQRCGTGFFLREHNHEPTHARVRLS